MSFVNLGRYGYISQDSSKYVGFSDATLRNIITTSTTYTTVTLITGTTQAALASPFSSAYNQYSHYFDNLTGYKMEPTFIAANSNFTYECWFYLTTDPPTSGASVQYCMFTRRDNASNYTGCEVEMVRETQNYLRMRMLGTANAGTSWNFITFGSSRVRVNKWYHLAFVKNGTAARLYLDGVQEISGTYSSATLSINENTAYIGILPNAGTYRNGFPGYITNFRYTPSAVYTAGFTPPTVPWSTIGSSLFYMNLSARGPRGITLNT